MTRIRLWRSSDIKVDMLIVHSHYSIFVWDTVPMF